MGGFCKWTSGMVLPILLLFELFYFKMLGAGDIKLLSMAGSFMGSRRALRVIMISFFFAAILSVWKLIYYRNIRERMVYMWTYFQQFFLEKKRIPYVDMSCKDMRFMIHFSIPVLLAVWVVYFME